MNTKRGEQRPEDQARREAARKRLEELLLEGLSSGPATPMTAQDWVDIRREGYAHLEARRKRRGTGLPEGGGA